ncbi:transposase [Actinacidiphila soli]|uniref:transposase n=1 Tax=Actinacidiphila soli TaxID=2487275 RepID=UPI0013E403FD|nr:transposase [Actinacidiphila soli]
MSTQAAESLPVSPSTVKSEHSCSARAAQQRYAIRAGIEATLSQNVRTCGLRRTRYRGLARTHVQHVLTAAACNLTRVADWIAEPTTTPRRSTRFHALRTTTA